MLVGFSIGTLQHYVAFGVWGDDGFGNDALRFAALEGGTIGYLFGIPTGVLTYYAVLKRQTDWRLVAFTVGGSLVGGCLLGALLYWPSAVLTPFLTFAVAAWFQNHRHNIRSAAVT